jgi:outer membrane protein
MISLRTVFFSARQISLTIVALFLLGPAVHGQQLKIGTVNLKQIFEGYYRTKQADSVLEKNAQEATEIRDKWLQEHKTAAEEYKKLIEGANDQAVAVEERDKRKKAAENKLVEIRDIEKNVTQYSKEAQTRIEEQKARLRDGIVEEIRKAVNEKAKAGNFSFVVDTSGDSANNRTPFILYADGQNDLTPDVLAELNSKAPLDALTSGGRNAPAKEEKGPATLVPPKAPQKKDSKK